MNKNETQKINSKDSKDLDKISSSSKDDNESGSAQKYKAQKPEKLFTESVNAEVRRISESSIRTISYISVVISISLSVVVSVALSIKFNDFNLWKIATIIFCTFGSAILGFIILMKVTWWLFVRKSGSEWYKYKTERLKAKKEFKKTKKNLKNWKRAT